MRAILTVVDVDIPVPVSGRALTNDQAQQALALFAHLLDLRDSGNRLALVHLDDALGTRPVGRRVDVVSKVKSDVN